jgi:hypothetical protein
VSDPLSGFADRVAVVLLRGLLAGIALVLGLTGVGVLTWAGFRGLTDVMDPAWAGLATGAGLLTVADLTALVALMPGGARRRAGPPRQGDAAREPSDLARVGADSALAAVRDHPKTSALAALVAGLVLGLNPSLRRAVLEALEP